MECSWPGQPQIFPSPKTSHWLTLLWVSIQLCLSRVICEYAPLKHQCPSSAQVGPSFIGCLELCCRHHRAKIHHLAPTVATRLGFFGYLESHCHGKPHQFIPCLTGGVAKSQLIKVGDGMSGRAIVSLMAQGPGLGPQQCFMLTLIRSTSVLCQKACTSGEALTSRDSHHASHFLPWAACPTLCNVWE